MSINFDLGQAMSDAAQAASDAAQGAVSAAGQIVEQAGAALAPAAQQVTDAAVDAASNPLGTVQTILQSVGQGFGEFGHNVSDQVKQNVGGWVEGNLRDAGLKTPRDFTLAGMAEFGGDVANLAGGRLREKAADLVGEQTLVTAERGAEDLKTFVQEAPMALWNEVLDAAATGADVAGRVVKKAGEELAPYGKMAGKIADRVLDAGTDAAADPAGAVRDLLNATKQGFGQFGNNLKDHLSQGLGAWVSDNLEEAGIGQPRDYSLGSILSVAGDVLEVTEDRLREKAAILLGERAVETLESGAEDLKKAAVSAPQAMWREVSDAVRQWQADLKA